MHLISMTDDAQCPLAIMARQCDGRDNEADAGLPARPMRVHFGAKTVDRTITENQTPTFFFLDSASVHAGPLGRAGHEAWAVGMNLAEGDFLCTAVYRCNGVA